MSDRAGIQAAASGHGPGTNEAPGTVPGETGLPSEAAASPELLVERLSKSYGSAPVLNETSISARRGEIIALLGPSGCGKTTMLRCIAGLEVPNSGLIKVGGQTLYDSTASVSVPAERRNLGLVFQSYAIWPHMTVRENVAYGLKLRKVGRKERRERVDYILAVMGMSEYADRHPGMLSGGQQQRVAMARSVVTEPRALLLDEPFSNLDATMRGQTREYIRSVIKRLNMTSVLVTHDHEEAMEFADCVYVLSGGEVVERGSPRELYQRPTTRRASAALGYANLLDIDRCERARDGTVAVHVPGLPAPLLVRPSDTDHQKILDERIAGRMAASLLIRPEDIVLLPPGSAAQGEENVAAGVVEAAFFVGRGSIYNVRIDDTLSLRVESREDYAASDRVDIRLPANCLVPVV